ncbi:MAG: hypothetical protein U5R14_02150 [Gemmatimonadota bacterium]|nr:hypothetical protein [Gemmatimonadota bacterium]
MKRIVFVLLTLALAPGAASSQIVWDAPTMLRPGAPSGLSVLLLEPYPGNEFGALAVWRQSPAPVGLGLRAGVAEDAGGELAALFGLDVSGPLSSLEGGGDPGMMWWAGAGLGVGDELVATFPAGIVLGWNLESDGVVFSPNVGGHIALDILTGPGDDLDLDGAFDLGVDLGFSSGIQARFGASLGGREALAIGLRLPM